MRKGMTWAVVAAGTVMAMPLVAQNSGPLEGTWTLVAADQIKADGTRGPDYGAHPRGQLVIDADGHYGLQIYASERPRFAAGQKKSGTPEEYAAAVLGSSNHYGRIAVDDRNHVMTLSIEASSYPNQEGTRQTRVYELHGDTLSYRVLARPDGSVPISVWRRVP